MSDAFNSSSMSSNRRPHLLLLLFSLTLLPSLRGLPGPMGSEAPWYSEYDIEEFNYASDYYGDSNTAGDEGAKELCARVYRQHLMCGGIVN